MKKIFYFLTLLIGISVMSCGPGKKGREMVKDLNGKWNVTAVNGEDVEQNMETPYLQFDMATKRLSGMTGCNRVMGDIYTSDTNKFSLTFGKLASTKMMCHDDSLEISVLKALSMVKEMETVHCRMDTKGTCMALLDKDGKHVLTLQLEP